MTDTTNPKKSPAELVIDTFGIRPLARKLDLTPTAVLRWRSRGQVPSKYHKTLIELSEGKLSADDMVFGR